MTKYGDGVEPLWLVAGSKSVAGVDMAANMKAPVASTIRKVSQKSRKCNLLTFPTILSESSSRNANTGRWDGIPATGSELRVFGWSGDETKNVKAPVVNTIKT